MAQLFCNWKFVPLYLLHPFHSSLHPLCSKIENISSFWKLIFQCPPGNVNFKDNFTKSASLLRPSSFVFISSESKWFLHLCPFNIILLFPRVKSEYFSWINLFHFLIMLLSRMSPCTFYSLLGEISKFSDIEHLGPNFNMISWEFTRRWLVVTSV